MMEKRILIVDDDQSIGNLVAIYGKQHGFDCLYVESGERALELLKDQIFDVILLDVMMGGLDGYEVLERIRNLSDVPVLFLTAKDAVSDRVFGLQIGADDYIIKPFNGYELFARVDAVLRRANGTMSNAGTRVGCITLGRLSVHEKLHRVYVDEDIVHLTLKEHELLLFLLKHNEQVFSREQLLNAVWGHFYDGTERTVDTHIKTLRMKLKDVGNYVATVWGVGYKFEVTTTIPK
ncbi:MAG: response regulator transcription factor [Bacilli bacterium]